MYGVGTVELIIILAILGLLLVPFVGLGVAVYLLFFKRKASDE